jgi:hypothetical protein
MINLVKCGQNELIRFRFEVLRRRHDLTVCRSNAQLGEVAQTVEVLELPKLSTPEQIPLPMKTNICFFRPKNGTQQDACNPGRGRP